MIKPASVQKLVSSQPLSIQFNIMRAGAGLPDTRPATAILLLLLGRLESELLPQIAGKLIKVKLGHRQAAAVRSIADDNAIRLLLFHMHILIS